MARNLFNTGDNRTSISDSEKAAFGSGTVNAFNVTWGILKGLIQNSFTSLKIGGTTRIDASGNYTGGSIITLSDRLKMSSVGSSSASIQILQANGVFQITDETNIERFRTTSTGIGVTGNVVASGTVTAQKLNLSSLPASATGLTSGDVWRDGTTLKIVI